METIKLHCCVRFGIEKYSKLCSGILLLLLILTMSPVFSQDQEKIIKLTDKVYHTVPKLAVVGEILDVLEIITGKTSVRVKDLYEGEKMYADIGDLIQIPITIEFEFEDTWGEKEWIFFEYSIELDGIEVIWGRIPEEGYFEDDATHVLKTDLWIGLDKWNCGIENKRTLTVYGNVFDDTPFVGYGGENDKKDPNGSTRKQKKWGMSQNPITHNTKPLSDDSKTLTIIVLNPFFGTKPTAINNRMEHGEPIGALYLERELHWKTFHESGKGRFSPVSCDVIIEPLESLPPAWIWKMNLPNPATLQRNSHITVRYDGHHVHPSHYSQTVNYTGWNSYTATGKFTLPPVSKDFSDLLTSHWEKQSWSTIFLYGGIAQDNMCFPARYRAFCRHDRDLTVHEESDPALADRYKGDPVITPHGDDKSKKEDKKLGFSSDQAGDITEWEKRGWTDPPGSWPDPKDPDKIIRGASENNETDGSGEILPGSSGSRVNPVEEWEKRGWTDPPGSWPDLKNPDNIVKDALKGIDLKKYDGVQKSVVTPKFALESDIITGTVIIDAQETRKPKVLLFDVSPKLVTGLVTVDDEPVIHTGEANISQSGKNALLGWMSAVGSMVSSVKLLSKGKDDQSATISIFPRSDISNPFADNLQDDAIASRLGQIWADNTGEEPEKVPPVLQYSPVFIEPGATATFYGFFPNRKFRDDPVSSEHPYELEGLGLGPVDYETADRSEVMALLSLASSSIEYRVLVPTNIPIDRFRVYVLLSNGEILPTEHITNVIDFITEGTPVLRTQSSGQLTIRLKVPQNVLLENESFYLSVENLTPEVIMLNNGQSQTIRLSGATGTNLTIPFTANKIGEYGVRVGIKEPGDMITPEQAGWLISNRFDEGMMNQLLRGNN